MPVPSVWSGRITGVVCGQPFELHFRVELTRKLRRERNPFYLFAGTRGRSSIDVGSSLLTSAQRYATPITGRTATLRYLRVTVSGRKIRSKLVDKHQAEAVVSNGFTAPNVCLSSTRTSSALFPARSCSRSTRARLSNCGS